MELNKIYCEDCITGMKKLRDNSIDLIVTDPPYVLPNKTCSSSKMSNNISIKNIADFSLMERYFSDWFVEIKRILKPTGKFIIFCNEVSYVVLFRTSYTDFDTQMLIWEKGKRVGLGRNYRKTFELIIYGKQRNSINISEFRKDIINFDIPKNKFHPTQKPVDLIEYLIRPEEPELVLDPFMGSGSTAIACKNIGCNYIGFELNPEYVKIAEKRIREVSEPLSVYCLLKPPFQ